MTLKELFTEWLKYDNKDVKARKTYLCYVHASKRVGKCDLQLLDKNILEISQKELQQCLTKLQENYSKSSIRHTRVAINLAFQYARNNGYMDDEKSLSTLQIPKNARVKKIDALTISEQQEVEKIAKSDVLGDVVMFLLYTGLRINELMELRWSDYNATKGSITIRESKTNAGQREIPLCRQAKMIINYNLANIETPYIFLNTEKNKLQYTSVRRLFSRIQKKSGISTLTAHVCRHSFATRFIERGGSPKALSEILGHRDVAFTLKRYMTSNFDFLRNFIIFNEIPS